MDQKEAQLIVSLVVARCDGGGDGGDGVMSAVDYAFPMGLLEAFDT